MSRFLLYVLPAANLLLLFLPYVHYPSETGDYAHDRYDTSAWRELGEIASDAMGHGHLSFAVVVLAVAFFFPTTVFLEVRSARAQLCANAGSTLQFQLVTSWRIFFGLQAIVMLFACFVFFVISSFSFHNSSDSTPAAAAIVHFASVVAAALASLVMAFSSILSEYSQNGCVACAIGDAPPHRRKPATP